ncbi:MAG: class I SAM-dependent methyltransferase [Pseudonocardiaceae bacterium]
MLGGWKWDESLFAGTAQYYEQGRLPYASGLADTIAGMLPPDGESRRLLDIGCGPGTLSLRLVDVFTHSVGLDPDPEMIAEARRRAWQGGVTTAEFVQARGEDLPMDLGMFDVAAFGQSFHWMDRDQVAATVRDMLPSGGLFMQISDLKNASPRDRSGLADPAPPYEGIRELVRKHLGPVRRAGRGVLLNGTPDDEVSILARNGFDGPDRITVAAGEILLRTPEDVIAWVYSRSDSAPGLFGDGVAAFNAELCALLTEAAPHARFAEHVPDTELVVWRRP